ncbi:MAG: AAA family ATPase [Candidatus Omnitrophica bacterium]|nr:AAA family ATPase [Candidatus Omnitrophota bacterium]
MDFLEHWKLKEKPFENTGDPKFFYYSPSHKEALTRLIYVIRAHKAGALLAGDYGTGKTTIANEILHEIKESGDYQSICISNPLLTSRELLQEIGFQLGAKGKITDRVSLRRFIEERLKQTVSEGRHTVLIVDEAHLINKKDVLEELRLLMNLQYNNNFLVTIIMMGQLELRDIINSMAQFKQRFAMFYVLKNLNEEDTVRYIEHRLKISGTDRSMFTPEASSYVYRSSQGRPRQINNICDMALLVGSLANAGCVDENIVRDIVKDLGEKI